MSIELGKKCIEIWGEDKFIGICKIWDNYSDLAHFNILNINWELISKKWYDRITPTPLKQLYIVELNKLENIINEKGRVLSKDWYKEIEYDPQSQWFEATLPDYGKMFIYPNGSYELEQPIYPELIGDVCCKKTDDGILAVDSVGNPIINDILRGYTHYQHMIELITLEGKSIFLNDKGDEISELNGFDKVNVINRPNLIFAVYKNNNLNVYDFPNHRFLFNQWIPNAKIDKRLHVNGNRYAIYKDGLYNVFDLNGNFLLKNWYEHCTPVYDGRVIFSSKEVKETAILNQDNTVQYITTESKRSIQLTMNDLKMIVLEAVENIQKRLSSEE